MKRNTILLSILLLVAGISLGQSNCLSAKLVLPQNNTSFYLNEKERPVFEWENRSADATQKFELSRSGKILYSTTVTNKILDHSPQLENIYQNGKSDTSPYQWRVYISSKECEEQVSKTGYFYVLSSNPRTVASGGAEINVTNIFCHDPAFDSLGMVHFSAQIDLINLPTSFANWDISTLTFDGNTIPVTQLKGCAAPFAPQPNSTLSIPPGITESWCLDFSVPFGSNTLLSSANGMMGSLPTVVSDLDSLPSCICNYCNSLDFINVSSSLTPVNNMLLLNYNIVQQMQINGLAPIKEFKAVIIGLRHTVNNDACKVCTKEAKNMGLFNHEFPGNPFSHPKDITNSTIVWQSGNEGNADVNNNSDYHTNQLIWTAQNPVTGVDFSTSPRVFQLPIGLPESHLECCNSEFEMCIRYIFTDINCKTCDFQVCYTNATP